nr:putative late blight resistance protein homolog R1B-16 [Ipomoea batatas]
MIESLCKKLRFLQAFLEDSQKNNINCPAWTDLETEIRDVAAEAESKIESKLYKHYLFYNEKTEIRDVPVKPCGFCKLKYLQVHAYSSLKHWSVDADHFPVLERIFLNHCYLLMEFPTGFGEINTLQLIELKNCSSLLVTSAKSLQEERQDLGDNKLVLQFYPGPRCNFRKEKLRVTKQMQLQKRKAEGDKTVGLEPPLLGETSVGLKIYGSSILKVKD